MTGNIKVSVVLPVYNMADFLEESVTSLLSQSLEEMELLAVDDGSTDGSLEMLREYEKRNPKLRVVAHKADSFCAALPRNLGLSQAKGDYLLFLDPDDGFHPDLLQKTYEKAVDTGADVVLFDAVKFHTDTGEKIPTNQFLNPDLLPDAPVFSPLEVADHLFLLGDGVAWNKLFRRSFLLDNHLQFFPVHVVDDMNFTFSALVLAESIAVVAEPLLYYRVGNGASQMENLHRDPLTPVKVLLRLKAFLEERGLFACYEKTYVERGIGLCMFYLDGLKNPKDFTLLYDNIQGENVEKLGFSGVVIENTEKLRWLNEVQSLTAKEYDVAQKKKTEALIEKGKPYGIYGFGVRTDLVYGKIVAAGGRCVALSDSSPQKWGQRFQDLRVVPPEELKQMALSKVFISSPNYFEDIKKTLLHLGFAEQDIALI